MFLIVKCFIYTIPYCVVLYMQKYPYPPLPSTPPVVQAGGLIFVVLVGCAAAITAYVSSGLCKARLGAVGHHAMMM